MVPAKRNDILGRRLGVVSHSKAERVIVVDMPRRNGRGIELLADPTRRQLIAEIALRPRRSSRLADDLGLSRPATSRQLKLLRDAGLVVTRRSTFDRRVVIYVIAPRAQGPILAWLAGTQIGRPIALRIDDDGSIRQA